MLIRLNIMGQFAHQRLHISHLIVIILILTATTVDLSDSRKHKKHSNHTTKGHHLSETPKKSEASEISPRVVGGTDTGSHEIPHQVRFFNPSTGKTFCGGTIIDPLYILSAAHCFQRGEDANMITYVGDYSVSKKDEFEQVVKVVKVTKHKEYNPTTYLNDIALLKLSQPLTYSQGVQPALIPTIRRKPTGDATVSGWGYINEVTEEQPDILQKVVLPIVTKEECEKSFRATKIAVTQLCAGTVGKKGKDSCKGDSGGPLTQPVGNGSYQLIGIVSVGRKCAKGKPAIYTDVAQFNYWIFATMKGYNP